jgi:hypothetical protein
MWRTWRIILAVTLLVAACGDDVPDPPEDGTEAPDDVSDPPEDVPPVDCEALATEAKTAVAALKTCASASECGAVTTTVCGLCTTPVNTGLDASGLQSAATSWEEACGSSAPDDCCQAPTPASYGCLGGECVGCDYTCDINCVCKKDPSGCDVPECDPDECSTIAASVDDLLPTLSGCTSAGECTLFEYPICGSAGCFQHAVNATADLAPLLALAKQGQAASCAGFTCGCGYGPMPVCLDGQCTLCPGPDCKPDCDTLLATIVAEAALAKYCKKDTDCKLLESPICAKSGLGCYAVAVAVDTPLQQNLSALLTLYSELKCPSADCDCPEPVASCNDDKCQSWVP